MERMRIAITGAGGRLGAALARIYGQNHEVVPLGRKDLDLLNDDIRTKLDGLECDVLINCAALTNVDYCETNEPEAMRVNAEAAGILAEICTARGIRLIHISTDYVFDGTKEAPYTEGDEPRPISIYGQSKREGELAILSVDPQHLVARVSWVFGPDRPSFIDAVVDRALKTDDLAAVADKDSVPAYTLDLALYIEPLFGACRDKGGILHLANSGRTSWREYGEYAVRCAAEMGAPVKGTSLKPLRLDQMQNFVAKRPVHTAMDVSRFAQWTGITPRSWQEAVRDYITHAAPVTAPFRS